MKFSCDRDLLMEAINVTQKAVTAKSTLPALEGLLLQTVDYDRLKLTGYDLEIGIECVISGEVEEQGAVVLGSKIFGDIIRKMPSETVTITVDDNLMTKIDCGRSEFNIVALESAEYPELPKIEGEAGFSMPQATLRSMIRQTLFAVSTSDNKPVHTGSMFEISGGVLRVISVDGYRLALRRENVAEKKGADAFSFVVPGSALGEVEKICSGEEDITVIQGARHILFQTGDIVLVCRRLEGEFLPYKSAIPRNNPIHVACSARALLSSIERVSLIISEKLKSPLRCVFGSGMVSITTKTAIGDAADQCPIDGDGQELEIGFNNKYLMDALKAAPAEKLRLEFTSGVAPCVILPAEGEENFIYMVLPVRLKAN